jgi:serine/threonine protein kinase
MKVILSLFVAKFRRTNSNALPNVPENNEPRKVKSTTGTSVFKRKRIEDTVSMRDFLLVEIIYHRDYTRVWIAIHIPTNKKCVIKIINFNTKIGKLRIQKEILIHFKTDHPLIVKLMHAFFHNKETCVLVMDYFDGPNLRKWLSSGFDFKKVFTLMLIQLVDAIKYIHECGIAHRDIKLENILMDANYNIKIIDFGVSTMEAENSNTACGTEGYMAPEVSICPLKNTFDENKQKNKDKDEAMYNAFQSDIWSLGIVCFELLTGRKPERNPTNFPHSLKLTDFPIKEMISACINMPPHLRPSAKQLYDFTFEEVKGNMQALLDYCNEKPENTNNINEIIKQYAKSIKP